jgi:hypothetical protein
MTKKKVIRVECPTWKHIQTFFIRDRERERKGGIITKRKVRIDHVI